MGGSEVRLVPPCSWLLQVSFNLLPRSRLRLVWVLCELPMGASLAQQIPALIKGFLEVMEPLGGIADLTWVFLHLAAQLMLSIDHLANAREDVGVVHATQPKRGLR